MDTLFTDIENSKRAANAPLAVRMRPQTLDDLIGQEDALGEGTWLRSAIEADTLSSVILYGPAGTGKTSSLRPPMPILLKFRLSVARSPICVVKFQMLTSV